MALVPGARVGPYEVTSALGAGGMGEVWRARDPRLGRDVAIKVLPAALANDPERRARFEREGRVLASLNHPHVAAVLGLEDADGAPALVMELVEGETLAEHLSRQGAFAPAEALAIARQVAEALEYAHERGIVHRDLKPANVKRTPDGTVKVLDFGLAKALAPDEAGASSPQVTQSPTMSVGTQTGVLLGTAAYMAPEQARGKPVDKRADIWAFGVLVFELLTGRQLFAGETVSDTIARILEREPDWDALPARTPARLRDLLGRCLVKDVKQRLRDMGDARLEVEAAMADLASGRVPAAAAPARPAWPWAAAAVLLVVAALVAGWALRGARAKAPPLRVSVAAPDDLVFTTMMFGEGSDRALYASGSPRAATSRGEGALYRRALDSFEWRKVEGSEGKLSWDLSPDGRWLYMLRPVAAGSRQIELQRMPVDASTPPVSLMPWDADSLDAWESLPEGRIAVIQRDLSRFAVLRPGDGAPVAWRPIAADRQLGMLRLEATLPGGGGVLGVAGYYGANGWVESAAVLGLDDGRLTVLEENTGSPRVMPGGELLMTRGGKLLAAPYDAKARRLSARPVAILDGLRTALVWDHAEVRTSSAGDVGVLFGGTLARKRSLVLVGADGRVEPWSDEQRAFESAPIASPTGNVAAATVVPPGVAVYEVVLVERGRPGVRRLSGVEGEDCTHPVFSPDGRFVAWARQGSDSTTGVFLSPTDGLAPARALRRTGKLSSFETPLDWFPDGRSLLVATTEDYHRRLTRFTLAGDGVVRTDVLNARYDVGTAALAPDGRRLAYESYEGSEPEVMVAMLGPDGRAGPGVSASHGYGVNPRWTAGGRTLLWGTRGRAVMAAAVSPALEVAEPARRADLSELVSAADEWSALPDGRLLVTRKADGEGEIRRFDLLLDYGADLKRALKRAGAAGR